MTQLEEAVSRYHRSLDQNPERLASWMGQLREQFEARHLIVNGRPVTPVLRPHFLSRRQYSSLVKSSEALNSAIERVRTLALGSPLLMARMEMLPAEKMLATVDPGYSTPAVASLLETQVNNGSIHCAAAQADMPHGLVFGEILSDIFYDSPPVKEFRKKHKLVKAASSKPLITAMLKAWKEFGGRKQPTVAILEFRQPFASFDSHEYTLLAELLRKHGLQVEVVSPEQLDYRNDVLRRGDFAIDLVYRGVRAHEFLMRYDLTHPLVRAYREHRVCVVNSFRTELTRKKALLALLTDEVISSSFPAVERNAIRDTIPWTRVVGQVKTTREGKTVDLPDYIRKNREKLVLRPNEDSGELHATEGWRVDDTAWDRALRVALRNPFVVQERVDARTVSFPVDLQGDVAYRDLLVDVTPHSFLGKIHGCSSRISAPPGTFSTIAGLAPAFILEGK
ncbi:MAG: hypothetical protein HZB13_06540 [Acidobacteria bacterium]|nr:hypothetical protein [Acidobacteriota bacterium]